jgi:hypothetical protein
MNFPLVKKAMQLVVGLCCMAGQITAQHYRDNRTLEYEEIIRRYSQMDREFAAAKLLVKGQTDIGKPLHLFVISKDGDFNFSSLRKKNKAVIFINNGIHPGEPDGIEASLILAEQLLRDPTSLPANVVIAIIPVYNVDGALNRSCCSRANQNGPEEYGFRGNARNLDLNRDFIKCDSENARSFCSIYQEIQPDIFVDTHTSNGADYQYVMTLISTQEDKIHPALGKFMRSEMVPALYSGMEKKGYGMCPYVETIKRTPEEGIAAFLETPRYSTGYTALFNTIGFVTETHMWKPFAERVESTRLFLQVLMEYVSSNHVSIKKVREEALRAVIRQKEYPLQWELDTSFFELFPFKGYEAKFRESNISGLQRLYYDRSSPYQKNIKFFSRYRTVKSVTSPHMYVLPQAWKEVISRLELNGVKMEKLDKDTVMRAEVYYIESYKSPERPYEGHFLHRDVKVGRQMQEVKLYRGDRLIRLDQPANRFIVETLEPEGTDSYFAWNFFDSVLQQKEWFSDYIFEEQAEEILQKDPGLKERFLQKKRDDSVFSRDHFGQLYFIYKNSPYYEKTHLRYPVIRVPEAR